MPVHVQKVCQLWAVAAAALNLTEGLLGHAQLPAYVACFAHVRLRALSQSVDGTCERLQQLDRIYQSTLLSLRASQCLSVAPAPM
jgi:hypothetical protein